MDAIYEVRFFHILNESDEQPKCEEIDIRKHDRTIPELNFTKSWDAAYRSGEWFPEVCLSQKQIEGIWRGLAETEQYGQIFVSNKGFILACEMIRSNEDKSGDEPGRPLELIWLRQSILDRLNEIRQ